MIKCKYVASLFFIMVKGGNLKPTLRYIGALFGVGTYFKDAPKDSTLKRWTTCEWTEYESWLSRRSLKTDIDWYRLRNQCLSWENPPLISILTPTYNTPKKHLYECINSVLTQAYPFWEMCILFTDFLGFYDLTEYASEI